jgi:methionyl-tRNA synthetase
MQKQRFYITTAISYPNGEPHIGHAYELIATDAIARFKRLDGFDVFFLTGTDEHGQKMLQTAAKLGVTAAQLADQNSAKFRHMAHVLNASNDDFIRTTEPRHHAASQALWQRMEANGDIYLSKYSGWYSVRDEAYFDEAELTITDGAKLSPNGAPVEWREEDSYMFALAKYQQKLLDFYEANPSFIAPDSRRNEVLSFVKSGLHDLSISRTAFDWGVKVPNSPEHVMYVWVDALTNYLTATGFPNESAARVGFWPADVHVVGKDIVRFHAVYWPAFLMSAGLPLPGQIFGHGFLLSKGEKMSKSIGNVVSPFTFAQHYGVDSMRYFFLREVGFGQDGNYSHEAVVARINADLANDLGNLVQRSLSMVAKNADCKIPECGELSEADRTLLDAAYALPEQARKHMESLSLNHVVAQIWSVVADTNKYFAVHEPWQLRKTDLPRMNTVLYVTAEVLRMVGIMAQPFVPEGASKILDLLDVADALRDFSHATPQFALKTGTELPAPAGIFPRYVEPVEISTT